MRVLATLNLTSALADLGQLYPWLERGLARERPTPDLSTRMQVALEEAAANVAMHGYPDDAPGRITVELLADPDALLLRIEDEGAAFDPTASSLAPDQNLAGARVGGRGIRLIRGFCQVVSYERSGSTNRLCLRFDR